MEICRAHEGIYETDYLVYIDESGRILLHGEAALTGRLTRYDDTVPLEVFQSPSSLRCDMRHHIVNDVLAEIRSDQTSWSWSTAIRAFLFSADLPTHHEMDAALQAIEACWHQAPICTSLVIVFWQRYLCQLADEYNASRRRNQELHAMDWISQWMPLKSDRALPGDLLSTLDQCGWNIVTALNKVFIHL
jgi:hypothetical protein